MVKRLALTILATSLLVFSSAGVALGAAVEGASCVGLGASINASSGESIPQVLAIARAILGTQGVGGFVSPSAQQHEGSLEACFPDFGPP
jgi:hypothetical protein